MLDTVYYLLDEKNNYILNLNNTYISNYLYFIIIIILISWYYIWYNRKLSNPSIIVGIVSTIIFFGLDYFSNNKNIYIDVDKDNWFIYKGMGDNLVTNFNDIKDNLNLSNYDLLNEGILVTKNFIDKLKKQNKIITQEEYTKTKTIKDNQNIKNKEIINLNIYNTNKDFTFQVYTLITVLFTILSLTWKVNKRIFNKILQFFVYTIVLSTPIAYSFFWIYNNQYYINFVHIKQHLLFQSLSVTLSMLTELLVFYSK